jgi:hypothetical protein
LTLNVVYLWGSAWQAAGYAAEGDWIGALGTAADKLLEKGAGTLAGAAGALASPAGAVVGAAAAAELHKATTGHAIEKYTDKLRNQRAQQQSWGENMQKVLRGTYSNSETRGKLTFTVQGNTMRCLINGSYGKGRVTGRCSGPLGPDGKSVASMGGNVVWTSDKGEEKTPFSGTIRGTLTESGGSGTFSGVGKGETETGSWTVSTL